MSEAPETTAEVGTATVPGDWRPVSQYGNPPVTGTYLVTLAFGGTHWVHSAVFASGADHWTVLTQYPTVGRVIAWARYPAPYTGE